MNDRVISVRFLLIILAILLAGLASRWDITQAIGVALAASTGEHQRIVEAHTKLSRAIYLETTIRALPQSEQLKLVPWLITTKIDPEDRAAMRARVQLKYLEMAPRIYDWQREDSTKKPRAARPPGAVAVPPIPVVPAAPDHQGR